MKNFLFSVALITALGSSVRADEVTDTLASAVEAYQAGDIKYALEEIAYAKQLLNDMQSGALETFLPEAPEGWTREIDVDAAAGMAAMGGTGAVAVYKTETSGQNERFTMTIMIDSPMVAGMAGLFGNAALMGSQSKMLRVGREKFLQQNDKLMALIDGRVFVQVEGGDPELVVPMLETMDLRALGRFGL